MWYCYDHIIELIQNFYEGINSLTSLKFYILVFNTLTTDELIIFINWGTKKLFSYNKKMTLIRQSIKSLVRKSKI